MLFGTTQAIWIPVERTATKDGVLVRPIWDDGGIRAEAVIGAFEREAATSPVLCAGRSVEDYLEIGLRNYEAKRQAYEHANGGDGRGFFARVKMECGAVFVFVDIEEAEAWTSLEVIDCENALPA